MDLCVLSTAGDHLRTTLVMHAEVKNNNWKKTGGELWPRGKEGKKTKLYSQINKRQNKINKPIKVQTHKTFKCHLFIVLEH